jgi:hypothetical protein
MNFNRLISILVIAILPLIACNTIQQALGAASNTEAPAPQADQPATGSETMIGGTVPVYPNATDYKTGGNPMVDMMLNPMMQQFENQYGGQATVRFYAVPKGTTAQDIETFYNEKMNSMGWKAEAVQNAADGPITLVWNNQDKEIFIVSFMEVPQMEPMLVAILAQQS